MSVHSPSQTHLKYRCIINLGLYKSGTTTLAQAATNLGMKVYDEFPSDIVSSTMKAMLFEPQLSIDSFLENNLQSFINNFIEYDFVSDSWFSLLSVASPQAFDVMKQEASKRGVQLTFICTRRDIKSYLESELHHWVREDIEKRAKLSFGERSLLSKSLILRHELHKEGIERLCISDNVTILDLGKQDQWAKQVSKVSNGYRWQEALCDVGKQNRAPQLPIEAILLTMRVTEEFDEMLKNVSSLLDDIEMDELCTYMLVVAIDDDEYDTPEANKLETVLKSRKRLNSLHILKNPPRTLGRAPKICQIWASMAKHAWGEGASWVIFLGDDVRVHCPYHYRAIYRYFLDNQERFNLPQGKYFGCPWFHDIGFEGFPTFPIIGKEHFNIFGGLIPNVHKNIFVNQDLDPYLQRIYLKFGAAPMLRGVCILNACGGSDMALARYERITAMRWRERVLEDECIVPIQLYLQENCEDGTKQDPIFLVDVVVPSYRVNLDYLRGICSIQVPLYMRVSFIIIIDNPSHLVSMFDPTGQISPCQAACALEATLIGAISTDNNIRVRCNDTNLGASASRNRGIQESAAEYILFLDDDVIPEKDLLHKYGEQLKDFVKRGEPILGLLGQVRFPRYSDIPIKHAGVFMSYLIFSFEIAGNNMYSEPAWGVTANILFKRFPSMAFDTCYAKTGGGEDVDFALRLSQNNGNLKLRCCPSAQVTHLLWSESLYVLCKHFFNWAIGDSALFNRFRASYVYLSFPNFVETWTFIALPMNCCMGRSITRTCTSRMYRLGRLTILMFLVDVLVEMSWRFGKEFQHRVHLLENPTVSPMSTFAILAHAHGNFYVIVLECGRLIGHLKRGHVYNICHRFDWHCGNLNKSKVNFVLREMVKFVLFMVVVTSCP